MEKINLFLVDDHSIVRDGIKALLSDCNEINVLGEASNAEELFTLLEKKTPNVILLDISLPDKSGIEITKILKLEYPNIAVLILSMFTDDDFVINAIKSGAKGYLPKNSKKSELLNAIKTVNSGGDYYSSEISNIVAKRFIQQVKNESGENKLNSLTDREKEILVLVVDGLSNKEISYKLFISLRTVETHKTHILQKLELKSTIELVKYAIKNKIIDIK